MASKITDLFYQDKTSDDLLDDSSKLFAANWSFRETNIAASSNLLMGVAGLTSYKDFLSPYAGSVVAMTIETKSGPITAGNLDVTIEIDGTPGTATLHLDSTTADEVYMTQATGIDNIPAGGVVAVRLVTDGAFAPSTLDALVVVYFSI